MMARTGRSGEPDAALALSEILGGLPLAHEQAAARYCIRRLSQTIRGSALEAVGRRKGCTGRPSRSFDGSEGVCARDRGSSEAPSGRQTVDRVHRAALARADPAVPILRGAAKSSASRTHQISQATVSMRRWRAFVLDRELISDERNPNVTTDGVRLHHLVRQVAMTVRDAEAQMDLRPKLIAGMASVYPRGG